MVRRPCVFIPAYLHPIVQHEHNSKAVLVKPADDNYYLVNLVEWKAHYGVDIYAHCLMTNHVHLIVSIREEKGRGLCADAPVVGPPGPLCEPARGAQRHAVE